MSVFHFKIFCILYTGTFLTYAIYNLIVDAFGKYLHTARIYLTEKLFINYIL